MTRAFTLGLSTLFVAALVVGSAFVSRASMAAPATPSPKASPALGSAPLSSRQKRMVDTARNAFEDALSRYGAGTATLEEAATWSRRTHESDPDRLSSAATTAYVDRAARIEKEAAKRFASGNASKADVLAAAYFRAEAEASEAAAQAIGRTSSDDPNAYR